jgi:heterodisulfide reductase subunit D
MSSYRTKSIARATKKILDRTGTDYITLGNDERCCGSILLRTGQMEDGKKLVERNIETVKSKDIGMVMASCPGCYLAFTQDYPKLVGELGVEVVHVTQFMERLLSEGKLTLTKGFPVKATYHDPCHLGRWSGVYDSPRNVLKAIPQLDMVEMFFNKADAWCCGAGSGVMSLSGEYARAVARERLDQANRVGANAIVSACPFCKHNFEQAAKNNSTPIDVYDVVEVVASAMDSEGRR